MTDIIEKDEDGNMIDPISYEKIPDGQLIRIQEDDKYFHFDIHSLYQWIKKNPDPVNPLTRNPLSKEVVSQIKEYGNNLNYKINAQVLGGSSYSFEISLEAKLGDTICQLIKNMSRLRDIDDYDIIISQRPIKDGSSIYSHDLDTKLIDLGFDSSYPIIYGMIISSFSRNGGDIIRNARVSLLKFAMENDIEWLKESIGARIFKEYFKNDITVMQSYLK